MIEAGDDRRGGLEKRGREKKGIREAGDERSRDTLSVYQMK